MRKTVEILLHEKPNWTKDDFVFFWGHHKTNGINKGCFSQWWPCTFTVWGKTYNSAEQYMMAMKASLFNDEETYKQIMEATEPNTCKYLGRQVKNFKQEVWDKHCYHIVFQGNFAKFLQNEDLRKELLATKDKILVEASPYDHIWGIAMSKDHPDCGNPSKWKGTNLLGFALTEVREMLKCPIKPKRAELETFTYNEEKCNGFLISYSLCPGDTDWCRQEHMEVYSPPHFFSISTTSTRGGNYSEYVEIINDKFNE